jgi:hypothetical protein
MLKPRRRKTRRKSPIVQANGLTADELATKVGIEPRAIRYYIAERSCRPPGSAARPPGTSTSTSSAS